MSDALSSTFTVELPGGETYLFRKPGIFFRIEQGYRAADVRRKAYPAGAGGLPSDFGLDWPAVDFSRQCAILELYLEKASVEWPYSPGADGKPVVDSSRFPPEREQTVQALGARFEEEVARFRAERPADGQSAPAQAVAGQ